MIGPLDPEQAAAPGVNGSAAHGAPSVEALLFSAGAISADQLVELVRDAVLSKRTIAALALERGFTTRDMLETLLAKVGVEGALAKMLGEGAAASPEDSSHAGAATVSLPGPAAPLIAAAGVQLADVVSRPDPPLYTAPPAIEIPVSSSSTPAAQPVGSAVPAVEPPRAFDSLAMSSEPPVAVDLASAVPPPVTLAPPIVPSLSLDDRVRAVVARAAERPASDPPPAASEVSSSEPADAPAAFAVLVRLLTGEQVAVDGADSFERAVDAARALAHRFASAGEWPFAGGRCIRPEAVVSIDIERALDG